MYTAILFAVDFNGSGETLTCSQEVDTDDKQTVYDAMKKMAHVKDDQVDTILVVRNGRSVTDYTVLNAGFPVTTESGPEVFHHWTARGGDFEGL